MEWTDVLAVLDRYGLGAGLLFLIFIAMRWAGPRCEEIVKRHISSLDKRDDIAEKNAKAFESLTLQLPTLCKANCPENYKPSTRELQREDQS